MGSWVSWKFWCCTRRCNGLKTLNKKAALLVVAATSDSKTIKRALSEAQAGEVDPATVDLDDGYGIEYGAPYGESGYGYGYDQPDMQFDPEDIAYGFGVEGYGYGSDDLGYGYSEAGYGYGYDDLGYGYGYDDLGYGYGYLTGEGKQFRRVGVADLDDISDGLTRMGKNYDDEIIEAITQTPKSKNNVSEAFKQSQSKKGRIKILLDESDHIEWSLMNKLTKTFHSVVTEKKWLSSDQKVRTLCKESRDGKLRAVPASEALTVGGAKNLMWVDIDTYDIKAIKEWLSVQKLFKKGSYALVESSTGKSHLYVVTNIPLRERWQKKMRQIIRESMPKDIRGKLDRVYGPESRRAIFLPNTTILGAQHYHKI